jgi:dsRNA-specific ribonuclease
MFVIGVFVDNKLKGQGSGPSKQSAQVAAATDALKHYAEEA